MRTFYLNLIFENEDLNLFHQQREVEIQYDPENTDDVEMYLDGEDISHLLHHYMEDVFTGIMNDKLLKNNRNI